MITLFEGESNQEVMLTFSSGMTNAEISEVYVESANERLFTNKTVCDDSTPNTLKCFFNVDKNVPNKDNWVCL